MEMLHTVQLTKSVYVIQDILIFLQSTYLLIDNISFDNNR